MKLYALIVAGGTGERMKSEIPKQFIEIAGKPILMHTIEKFHDFDESIEIITVLPGNQLRFWSELQKKYSFAVPHTLVKGGKTRFDSVRNGLGFIYEPGLVAIHDGVRPFVSIETIKRCFDTAEKLGNAIPVISPSESLRIVTENDSQPVDRTKIMLIQTPQVFRTELIRYAYRQDYIPEFTDDAIVLERTGAKINLVEGNRENIKITNPEDLLLARALV